MEAKIIEPTSLDDISLKQYQEYLKLDENLNQDFLRQKMVEIFCGVKLSNVLLISMKDVYSITDNILNLLELKPKHVTTFKIKDQEFGIIPNLEEMSFGEYIDLDTYLADWQEMHKAMAVMYRPIKHKYKDTWEVTEYNGAEANSYLMEFMPLSVAFGAVLFFYRLGNDLLRASQACLAEELVQMSIPQQDNLPKNMDGITQYMHSQREILKDLIQLLHTELDNV